MIFIFILNPKPGIVNKKNPPGEVGRGIVLNGVVFFMNLIDCYLVVDLAFHFDYYCQGMTAYFDFGYHSFDASD